MNTEDLRTRGLAAQAAIEALQHELAPLLAPYASHIHYALEVQSSSITFDETGVNFTAGGNARGWFEEAGHVTYDYFADPAAYIKREVEAKEAAKRAEETKVVRDREAEEKRTLARLLAKHGDPAK